MLRTVWTKGTDRADAESVRLRVFVDEQGYARADELVPEEDDDALHLTAYDGVKPVGAGRLLPYLYPASYKAGRIAVLPEYRGKGLGKTIVEALCDKARSLGAETLYLDSQLHAVLFYEKCGFYRTSVVHPDCGQPHILMARTFALEEDAWLGFGDRYEAVIYRNDFEFPPEIESVTADILPLGFCEAYLNGEKLFDDLCAPAWTNYRKQALDDVEFPTKDVFCHRAYFLRLDLTAAAKPGKNTFAVHIGDGWYGQWESPNGKMRRYGEKTLCYRITVRTKDGGTAVFSSSSGGAFRGSFVTRTSMYYGETQDLRLCPPDLCAEDMRGPAYAPVLPAERPYTLIRRQTCPPDRILRRIMEPKVIYEFGDRRIYDIGENAAGFALLRFGPGAGKNERIVVRYAENLHPDGSLDFHSCGGTNRMSVDLFINRGSDEGGQTPLYPRFLWHVGRYVEVTGYHVFEAFCVAGSDIPATASFRCSDEVLNWYFDAFLRTQTANMHGCVPSDCPHRERLGYTGDGQLTAPAVMTTFDARGLYDKWLRDIADCQDIGGGHVQYTAPYYGGGGGPGGWGCAMTHIPWLMWRFYGDETTPRSYYPHMKKYLDYMEAHSDDGLVTRAEPGGWCLGDWCTPHNNVRGIPIPPPFVNTYFYIRSLWEVMELAPLAGAAADLPELKEREKNAIRALKESYFDETTGSFCEGVCGADAFALDLGLGDRRTLENLVGRYRSLGTFDTGIFGTPLVLKALFENGYGDDAVRLLANRGEVSFHHMMASGATTLWEEWFNEYSSCHPMFGASAEYLFRYILGIRPKAGSVGFREIEVEPVFAPWLEWAEGSVRLGGKTVTVRVERGKLVKAEIR